jgi:DNA replication protein DnaC
MVEESAMEPVQTVIPEADRDLPQEAVSHSTRKTSHSRSGKNECQVCHGTIWVPVDGGPGVRRCDCQKRKIAEERIRVILRDWPEYQKADLETYRPRKDCVCQENAFLKMRENPHGSYLLTGSYSRGKTHLMVAQYRHLALAGEGCLLRTARGLIEELRKHDTPPENEKEFISPVLQMVNLSDAGHLFIDDIDKAPARSGFRLEMLFDLFDTIKRRQLGLTVTSNLPLISKDARKQDLRAVLSEPVASRLYRICTPIEL